MSKKKKETLSFTFTVYLDLEVSSVKVTHTPLTVLCDTDR